MCVCVCAVFYLTDETFPFEALLFLDNSKLSPVSIFHSKLITAWRKWQTFCRWFWSCILHLFENLQLYYTTIFVWLTPRVSSPCCVWLQQFLKWLLHTTWGVHRTISCSLHSGTASVVDDVWYCEELEFDNLFCSLALLFIALHTVWLTEILLYSLRQHQCTV